MQLTPPSPNARVWIGTCAVAAFVFATIILLLPIRTVDRGMRLVMPRAGSFQRVVTGAVTGPAAAAGLRKGDILDLAPLSESDRFVTIMGLAPHDVQIPVWRNGVHTVATLRLKGPFRTVSAWGIATTLAMNLLNLALVFLLLRSPTIEPEKRALLGLLLAMIVNNVYYVEYGTTAAWAIAGDALIVYSNSFLFYFTIRFVLLVPQRRSAFTALLGRTTIPLVALLTAAGTWIILERAEPGWTIPFGSGTIDIAAFWIAELLLIAVIVLGLLDGALHSDRRHRLQIQWVASTLLFADGVEGYRAVLHVATGTEPAWLPSITAPLESIAVAGLAYAVLRHRLIDLGEVFTRAAIYGVVSAVLLIVFLLAEWVLARIGDILLSSVGLGTPVERSAGLLAALLAGLLARPVHELVSRALNNVFFAKQYRDQEALRRFAHEAEAATNPTALMSASFEVLCRHVDASYVAIFVLQGTVYRCLHATGQVDRADIDENSAIALRMRRFGDPFEVDDAEDKWRHAMMYPMRVVGRLVAFVVCGPKTDRTRYGEREREAISIFAHRVGTVYAWLSETLVDRFTTVPESATLGSRNDTPIRTLE